MTTDYRAMCAELVEQFNAPAGSIPQLAERLRKLGELADRARALLALPTPQPVAVSERLPGPEDCDEQGRCWLGGDQLASGSPTWILGYPAWASRFPDVHYRWLPANALPLPAGEGAS